MNEEEAGEKMLISPLKSGGEEKGELGSGRTLVRRRQRAKKAKAGAEEAKKRRLRDEQVRFLEANFGEEQKLESGRKVHLASEIGLDPKQVAVWFQNRRARWKSKRTEEEFFNLKAAHAAALLHNTRLENEVLKLKEKVSEAEEEIRKLAEGQKGDTIREASIGGSPCSSSAETDHLFLDDQLRVQGEVGLLKYMHDYNYNDFMMDWMNLYGP